MFYQIYPRSFQDSNGDGTGDINGIISHLDYLKWLGIGAVWICPIYGSPNADMGCDIRNCEQIMTEFGTIRQIGMCGLWRGKKAIRNSPGGLSGLFPCPPALRVRSVTTLPSLISGKSTRKKCRAYSE